MHVGVNIKSHLDLIELDPEKISAFISSSAFALILASYI